jgi:hypothetical protein
VRRKFFAAGTFKKEQKTAPVRCGKGGENLELFPLFRYLGRWELLGPRMCGLLDSTRSARKPYTKGASSVSSVTGSHENLCQHIFLRIGKVVLSWLS